MIKAAAGWYETTSLSPPTTLRQQQCSKPPSHTNTRGGNIGSTTCLAHTSGSNAKCRGGLLSGSSRLAPQWYSPLTRHNSLGVAPPSTHRGKDYKDKKKQKRSKTDKERKRQEQE
ncbi:hypothetical protein Tco_0852682 [Tanacetum coccineum]